MKKFLFCALMIALCLPSSSSFAGKLDDVARYNTTIDNNAPSPACKDGQFATYNGTNWSCDYLSGYECATGSIKGFNGDGTSQCSSGGTPDCRRVEKQQFGTDTVEADCDPATEYAMSGGGYCDPHGFILQTYPVMGGHYATGWKIVCRKYDWSGPINPTASVICCKL